MKTLVLLCGMIFAAIPINRLVYGKNYVGYVSVIVFAAFLLIVNTFVKGLFWEWFICGTIVFMSNLMCAKIYGMPG